MTRSRLGLKALGLCALVVSAMAFAATGAQAEVGANWKVSGKNVTGTESFKLSATIENEDAALLTTLVGTAVKILCKIGTLENTSLLKEGSLTKGGKVKFAGCETFLAGTLSANCTPKTAGVSEVIETNEGVGLLVLVGGVGETLIKSASGGALAVIESSEKCAVGQKITIEGELFLKDCEGKLTTEKVTHLVEADNVAGTLTANKKAATLDGSANVIIAGGTLNWSGAPA